jgi:hypothetical protein
VPSLFGSSEQITTRASCFLRAGVAQVVDHNVECGEEDIHLDHERVRFPSLRATAYASRL